MNDYDNVEILLVEDNPHDAEVTMIALAEHKLLNKLHWVKDGEEALDFIACTGEYAARNAAEFPKLILLDLKLPKVGGLDVLRTLKTNDQTRRVPVVVMTSSSEERDVVESYHLGTNAFVVKPVEFTAFAEAVAALGMFWLVVNKAI